MDKVIILGIYNFLGFGTCLKLLEEGIQVQGYRFFEEECEEYIEEKKLLIGRNANFEDASLKDSQPFLEPDTTQTVILISFYDLYYVNKEESSLLKNFHLNDFIKNFQNHSILKIVCIFPYDFLNGIPLAFQQQINSLKNDEISFQTIFLPTIYGPWQPKTFLFQQCFVKEYSKIQLKLDQREDTSDAIYIEDVVEEVIQLLHSSEMNSVVLKSEVEGNWLKCAQYLKIDDIDSIIKPSLDNHKLSKQIRKVNVKTPLQEGLAKQKQHLLRLIDHSN